MKRIWRAIVALLLLIVGGRRKQREEREERERIVAAGEPERSAENVLVLLLAIATLFAVAFIVLYAWDNLANRTQYLGIALGGCLAFIAASLILVAKRLIVTEEIEEEYPEPEEPEQQEKIAQIIEESGSRFTRKGLVRGMAALAGTSLGAALIAPALSFGPLLKTRELAQAPWRRGTRLVDEHGRPYTAADIEEGDFYTAYPEGITHELIGAPVVIVRLAPSQLHLPRGRRTWAPGGIVAYSKVCTHAGCAIALYRKPLFKPTQPRPALVCPCHYSTFDPATGGKVIFGPAGRDLPQLPLSVDLRGQLRALGNFSGPVGPSWWGVRSSKATPYPKGASQ